jgi:hypothetical protein
MNLQRVKRLRKHHRISKLKAAKAGISGQRPFVKAHPRRKVNKSTGFTTKSERKVLQQKAMLALSKIRV